MLMNTKMLRPRFAALLASLFILGPLGALAQPESFSPTSNLPPPAGTYISPSLWHVLFTNGIVIRDVSHSRFVGNLPPPTGGAEQTHTFNSTLNFEVSTDGGTTFTPAGGNAQVKVKVKHLSDTAGKSHYRAEMLALDLTSGTLKLRESPTLPSRGKTTIRPVAGGHMISSFFDIFTEVSLDGGATWTPAKQAAHVEFRNDPASLPPVPTPTPLLPPPGDVYVSPQQWHALYAQGIVIQDVKHKFFTPSQPPPPPGVRRIHDFDSQLDLRLSTDGGNTFQFVSAPATVRVAIENKGSSASGHYDTEMLALNLQLPGGPAGTIRLRESPTLPSRGAVRIASAADGSVRISSFFDIFTEISLDNGGTWSGATSGPVRVVLEDGAPPQPVPTPNLPPSGGEYISPQQWHALYANGIIISNASHNRFTSSQPPPPVGVTASHAFDSEVSFTLVQPGQPPSVQTVSAPAAVTVSLTGVGQSGGTFYYDTEMLQLDIVGGSLPVGLRLRESPTRASSGRTSVREVPGGTFAVDSFFDIWTEISLDGGNTWSPMVSGPGSMSLRQPPTVPLAIACPANITVPATGNGGAAVDYTVNATGGCGGTTVSSTPPSGSLFPVGTTTVTSVAKDACGNQSTCAFTVTVQPPPATAPKEVFMPAPALPPPGVYISPAQYHVQTAQGIVIRDVRHHGFNRSEPPPPPGGSRVHQFDSRVDFDLSTDNGQNFTPVSGNAAVTVRVTHSHVTSGGQDVYDTEMLALDLTGGGGLRLRESPTLPSRGQTTLRTVPGGFMVDSFFDIWTEISLDGGQTWTPAPAPNRVELRRDVADVPPIQAPSNLLPPPTDAYVSPQQYHALYAGGVIIRDVKHKHFTSSQPPPAAGGSQTHNFNSILDMELSLNGGTNFQAVRVQAQTQVRLTHVGSPNSGLYDTEMLALTIPPGQLPGNLRLRESPTLPSRGAVRIASAADGSVRIGSFFDIFTEISLDGGTTWSGAASGPVRVQLERTAPEQASASNLLPPPGQEYVSPAEWHARYANGISIRNPIHNQFNASLPPPPPGGSNTHSFNSHLQLEVSLGEGQPFLPATANAVVDVRVRSLSLPTTVRYFDTEMLGFTMQLSAPGLPPGILVRESPTRASTGRTSIRSDGAGHRISSFFDIFTEISLDGGMTWSPSVTGPATVRLRNPSAPTVSITCPGNLAVSATSPAGAVVTFSVTASGGCDAPIPPTVTSTPPSGSVFPPGITTVTCKATDSCGNTAVCTFQVTVSRYVPPRAFPGNQLPPQSGQYVSPAQWHALYANGVIISNAAHRRFLQSSPPPPPGGQQVHTFDSTVEFGVSLDGGQTFQQFNGTAAAQVQVREIGGAGEHYETEMLGLDVVTPGPLRLRESPTLPSRGQTRIQAAPGGGHRISSFFDIWTEISLDGGSSWSPATAPVQVDLQLDPAHVPTAIQNVQIQGSELRFNLQTVRGLRYLIEYKNSLLDPEWFTLSGAEGNGQPDLQTDFLNNAGQTRYYRVLIEEAEPVTEPDPMGVQ